MQRMFAKLGTFFVINVIVLTLFAMGFGREYLRNREIERNISMLQTEQAALEGRRLEALSVIESLSSEYYLEQEGRTKRGLARPGEELVVIQEAQAAALVPTEEERVAVGNLTRWYYYFFDRDRFTALRAL